MSGITVYDFALANRAFERMTLREREQVLAEFAKLQFDSITDRFFEAIYLVISASDKRTGERPLIMDRP